MLGSPRRRAAGLLVALAATGAAALALAVPAQAAPAGRIIGQTTVADRIEVVFSATGLPATTVIDPASVRILIDGKPQPTTVRAPGGAGTAGRTAVLTIDTSGSMAGGGLDGAKSAANQFLGAVPDDVKVGLVTFSDDANVVVPPTTDREAVSKAVAGLEPSGDTALYDATVLAAKTAGTTGSRTVLVLSDGQDDGSQATLAEAASAVKSSGVVLDGVSLGKGAGQVDSLTTLAKSGRGFVITTDQADQLAAVFAGEAQAISKQVLAGAKLPAGVAGTSGNLTVTATAGGTALTDTVFTAFGATAATPSAVAEAEAYGPQPAATSSSGIGSTAVLVFAIIAVFVGLAVLLFVALVGASDRDPTQSRMRRRMSIYTLTGRQAVKETETTTVLGTSGVARSAVEFAGRMTKRTDVDSLLGGKLEAAGLPLKPPEWTLIHLGIALGAGLLLLLLSGGSIIASIIGIVFGALIPWAYLDYKARKRRNSFLDGLPDTLQLLAGSLSAGYSLPQAVDAVVREAPDPIGTEFNRALVETRLGVPLEDALEGVGVRMGSVDFAWVVMAIRIQREVGGNLAEILNTVAATLRERERLRRQVDVLSAEGKLSAWILGALPVLFVVYLSIARPDYLRVLYTEPLGWAMIIVGLTLFTVGVFWLRRAVKVEVDMSTLVLILGLVGIFCGIVLVVVAFGAVADDRRAVGRSLASIEAIQTAPNSMRPEVDQPFADRVIAPLMERFLRVGRSLTGADQASGLKRKLDIAGNPPGWDADRIIAFKAVGALIGLVLSLLLALVIGKFLVALGVGVALTLLGFFTPNIVLYQTGYNRTERMRRELPDALDLMTISVEAGLSFDAAVAQVSKNTTGPLAEEFFRVLQEMQIGTGRSDAIRALGERTDLPELRGFTTAMLQADAFGIPIANVLRVQAHELRVKRSQRAEEMAQKVPVKILFPLIFCILPPLFIAILGPAAIQIVQNFSGQN